jgi:hypothetical protein
MPNRADLQVQESESVLIRVVAPHFVAGVVARGRIVIEAAPILRYMLGWDGRHFADYCRHKGWKYEVLV